MKRTKYVVLGLASLLASGSVLASCKDAKPDDSVSSSETVPSVDSSVSSELPVTDENFIYRLSDDESSYTVALLRNGNTNTEVEIPSTFNNLPVVGIAKSALAKGSNIKKLIIGDNIASLESGVLSGCTSIEELTIPFFGASLEDEESTFGYLYGTSRMLQSMYVPQTLKKVTLTKQTIIPESSFEGLDSIEEVTLKEATTLKKFAFYDMDNLQTINLNEGISSLTGDTFNQLPKLTSLDLPSTLITYNNAISLTGLTKLHFPASVKEITNRNENYYIEEYSVDENSPYFTSKDGILFSIDMTELVSFPTNKKDILGYRIPDSVTKVRNNAFMNSDFVVVDINNVETIGDEAFRYSKLKEVEIPSSVISIGQTAFSGINSLKTVTFAESSTGEEKELMLGSFTFSSCPNISKLIVPARVSEIPEYFCAGDGVTEVTILGQIKSIGKCAFGSTKISELSVTFQDNATIGERIFSYCSNLTNFYVHFAEGVTTYPTLEGTGFGNGSEVPNIITDSAEIAKALKDKWTQKSYYISNELPSTYFDISEDGTTLNSFKDNNAVDVEIPYGVTKIGSLAFQGKNNIKRITIPETVTSIATNAFQGIKLMAFDFQGDNIDQITTFTRTKDSSSETGYADVEKPFSSLTLTGEPLFLAKDETAKEQLLDAVYSIRRNCVFLSSDVKFDENFNYAISQDEKTLIRAIPNSDGEFEIQEGVTRIEDECFYGTKLTSIDLTGIETIGKEAFFYTQLEEVTIPSTVTEIGEGAFENIGEGDTLTSVVIEDAPAKIGDYAFADNCNALESIDLGNAIVSLGASVFANNEQMTEITLPSSLEHIDSYCFEDSLDYITTINCCFSEEDVESKYTTDDEEYPTFVSFIEDYGGDTTINYDYVA